MAVRMGVWAGAAAGQVRTTGGLVQGAAPDALRTRSEALDVDVPGQRRLKVP
jgi:hypothetical protein